MSTNVEVLHEKGVLNKDKLNINKIDAINSLSADEVLHIQLANEQLSPDGASPVQGIIGVPL